MNEQVCIDHSRHMPVYGAPGWSCRIGEISRQMQISHPPALTRLSSQKALKTRANTGGLKKGKSRHDPS
jgi:hypothetical protein